MVLAAYAGLPDGRSLAERVLRTAAVAAASRRIGRLTLVSNPAAAVLLRDAALQLPGRLGPNLVLKQMDPVLGWRPPAGRLRISPTAPATTGRGTGARSR